MYAGPRQRGSIEQPRALISLISVLLSHVMHFWAEGRWSTGLGTYFFLNSISIECWHSIIKWFITQFLVVTKCAESLHSWNVLISAGYFWETTVICSKLTYCLSIPGVGKQQIFFKYNFILEMLIDVARGLTAEVLPPILIKWVAYHLAQYKKNIQ